MPAPFQVKTIQQQTASLPTQAGTFFNQGTQSYNIVSPTGTQSYVSSLLMALQGGPDVTGDIGAGLFNSSEDDVFNENAETFAFRLLGGFSLQQSDFGAYENERDEENKAAAAAQGYGGGKPIAYFYEYGRPAENYYIPYYGTNSTGSSGMPIFGGPVYDSSLAGSNRTTLLSWTGLQNALSFAGGAIEAGAGAAIGIGASWTGIGAAVGAAMIIEGGSTLISSGFNLGQLAEGNAPGINTSGFFGLVSSAAGYGPDNRIATTLDLGTNLALGGTSLLAAEGSVGTVYTESAENILSGSTPAGGAVLYGGNSVEDVAAFQKAGNPFLGAYASGLAAANDAAGFYDYVNQPPKNPSGFGQ